MIWDAYRRQVLVHCALGAALFAACGCGPDPNGPGSLHAITKAQDSAKEALEASGAKMERKQYPLGEGWVIDLAGETVSDSVFGALKRLDNVAELNLSGTNISDAEMENFADPKVSGTLVKLDLSNTEVSDDGLEQLKECRFLMNLNLSKTGVTEAGVEKWKKNHVADPRIGNAGVKIER